MIYIVGSGPAGVSAAYALFIGNPLASQNNDLAAPVPLHPNKYVLLTPPKQARTFIKTLTRHHCDALRTAPENEPQV